MMTPSTPLLLIRAGRREDQSAILALIAEIFGQEEAERASRRWDWQWHEDPRLKTPGYSGVVAEWEGQLVAAIGCIPAGLYLEGVPVEAFWFADALAHWGLIRKAMRAARKAGGQLAGPDLSKGVVGALLNDPAAGVYQLGKHLTDPMAVVAYKIGTTDFSGTGSFTRLLTFRQPISKILGKPLGLFLGWWADWFIRGLPKPTRAVRVLQGDFDDRFDVLFENARRIHPAITRRDREVLQWRYRQHPDTAYEVMVAEDDGALEGYLVVTTFHRHGQLRAYVLDLLARDDDPLVLDALLVFALRSLRKSAVHRVECYTGGKAVVAALQRLKFKERFKEGKSMSTVVRRIEADELYITRGDGDGG